MFTPEYSRRISKSEEKELLADAKTLRARARRNQRAGEHEAAERDFRAAERNEQQVEYWRTR
ncbi:hypothetical protein [Streptomyces nigrescens]